MLQNWAGPEALAFKGPPHELQEEQSQRLPA